MELVQVFGDLKPLHLLQEFSQGLGSRLQKLLKDVEHGPREGFRSGPDQIECSVF